MTNKRFNFPDTVPLRYDDDDDIRVTGSRITLDTVVTCFEMGKTTENILDGYPSLTIGQINAIRAWYLNNQAEADEYLKEYREETEKILSELRNRPESIAFRERIRSFQEHRNKS